MLPWAGYAEVRMSLVRVRPRYLLLLGAALAVACVAGYVLWAHRPLSSTDRIQVAEQVTLYLAAQKGTGIWEEAYRFVKVDGGDPSPELLDRLARVHTMLPISMSVTRVEGPGDLGVFHRDSGRRGVIFAVEGMRRSGRHEAVANATFYPHPEGAEGFQCVLEAVRDRWRVRACDPKWIS